MKFSKNANLSELNNVLISSGLAPQGITVIDGEVFQIDEHGAIQALSAEAQTLVEGFVPPPEFVEPAYGDEPLAAPQGDHLAQAVTALRAYVQTASPTQAQTVTIVKLLARVALVLLRRQFGGTRPPTI